MNIIDFKKNKKMKSLKSHLSKEKSSILNKLLNLLSKTNLIFSLTYDKEYFVYRNKNKFIKLIKQVLKERNS